jgi:hypothetical protein
MRPHRGAVILVYGILGLVVCQLFGVAAWVMGNDDLNEMAAGRMDSSGKDLTKAGRTCGMVATGILVFQLVIIVVVGIAMALSRN